MKFGQKKKIIKAAREYNQEVFDERTKRGQKGAYVGAPFNEDTHMESVIRSCNVCGEKVQVDKTQLHIIDKMDVICMPCAFNNPKTKALLIQAAEEGLKAIRDKL
jgi:hypothetical protein